MRTDSAVDAVDRETRSSGSTRFAEHIREAAATPKGEIDVLLESLDAHKREWAQLGIRERLDLLAEVRKDLRKVQEGWVESELEAKGIADEDTFSVATEWTFIAQALRAVRQIEKSLREIEAEGRPRIAGPVSVGPGDRTVMRVFPQEKWDRLIFQGVEADVWFQPGIKEREAYELQAAHHRDVDYAGGLSLVLGAGNVSMIPFCDALHKLFVDLQVVALKMNPVNAHVGPHLERCMRSLIEGGFLGIVYGDAEVGKYLCTHPLVEELHMTGSDKTYEAIVFGSGPEGRQRKSEGNPINTKPFTCELGNVTPIIVVPGPWTERDIEDYARHIATWLVANAGFACLIPRVIIQHESWSLRSALRQAIHRELERYPPRKAYYPGAFQIHEEFLEEHPGSDQFGSPGDGELPWTLMSDVHREAKDDICFRREGFGGLCAELSIGAESVADYLEEAVDFVNETLWGTLCAILIVHPETMRRPDTASAVERAISQLEYGTVSVNMLAFYGSYYMVCPWGGFPGHDRYDIQSGTGKNFNFQMLGGVEKVVLKAPFRRIDPLRVRSTGAAAFAEALIEFEASPGWLRLAKLMWSALRA